MPSSWWRRLFLPSTDPPRVRYCPKCGRPRYRSQEMVSRMGVMYVPPLPHENKTMCTYLSCRYNDRPSVDCLPDPATIAADFDPSPPDLHKMQADIDAWLAERRRQRSSES